MSALTLPLFPLSSIVLPGGHIPLRLFERRYLDMVSASLKNETGFGICLIREGAEAGEPAQPYPMGTHVRVVDFDQGDDGLLHIVASGIEEFELQHYHTTEAGLLVGDVELLARPSDVTHLEFTSLATKLNLILRFVEHPMRYEEKKLDDAEWVCNRLIELLPLEPEDKFELLRLLTLEARLKALGELQFHVESAKDV